jgi:hypothetical protein
VAGQGLDNVSPVWYKKNARFRGVSGPAIGSLERGNRDPARQPPGESQTPRGVRRRQTDSSTTDACRKGVSSGAGWSRCRNGSSEPCISFGSDDESTLIAWNCFVSVGAGCIEADRGTRFARGRLRTERFTRAVRSITHRMPSRGTRSHAEPRGCPDLIRHPQTSTSH